MRVAGLHSLYSHSLDLAFNPRYVHLFIESVLPLVLSSRLTEYARVQTGCTRSFSVLDVD